MPGSATISVEIELGWGFHDKADPYKVPELSDDGQRERKALEWFLDACDDANVPVSFNVVGHLLLESCDGSHDGPHPAGWFDRDPGTDAETNPLFYAPEVVELIRNANVDHEICTHTFSHVLLDEIADEVVHWELDRVQEVHDQPVISLVPPRHRQPPYHALRKHGIQVVRLPSQESIPSNALGRFLWILGRTHPVSTVETVDGIVETRTSSIMTLTSMSLSKGVSKAHPAYRVLPESFRKRRHARFLRHGLEQAVETDGHIHYWTHLYNLANDVQHGPVEEFLEAAQRAKTRDSLRTPRMEDLVETAR